MYGAVLAIFVCAIVCLYGYYMMNIVENFRGRIDASPCRQPKEQIDGFVTLAAKMSEVFEKRDLDYFMDYGTLLGAMRYNGPIPWDYDVDIGLLESSMDEHGVSTIDLIDELRERDLDVYYGAYCWGVHVCCAVRSMRMCLCGA